MFLLPSGDADVQGQLVRRQPDVPRGPDGGGVRDASGRQGALLPRQGDQHRLQAGAGRRRQLRGAQEVQGRLQDHQPQQR